MNVTIHLLFSDKFGIDKGLRPWTPLGAYSTPQAPGKHSGYILTVVAYKHNTFMKT